ncbi:MAG: tRNA (N6-isopentenyl adenosine(37)-C2)-methylthiotransferase MiaB [Chthonomonadales bacterium]
MEKPGYTIFTWGCQMNEEDTEQMALQLEAMGYQPVSNPDQAQVVLLNTCSVRLKPEEKVYSKLGELAALKERRPDLIVGVCGCMAQVQSEQIRRRAPCVDFVMGTGAIGKLPQLLRAVQAREAPGLVSALDLPPRKGSRVADVPVRSLQRKPKLKAHVPIMYGCDKFCTFCIVPLTRGRERSRPPEEILAEIQMLAHSGTREVTLLGQTVNSYGRNLPGQRMTFARLLERISEIRGIQRIRFTSPYPKDFTEELIGAMARLPKVCRHVHLPLQSADDAVLLAMHRGYTVAQYRIIVSQLRQAMPDISITTDLMVGFPGETEAQFLNTLNFVEEVRFDGAFMFAFSPRPGTKAASMPNQIPREVKVDRLNRLIARVNAIVVEKHQSLVGRTFEVLVEGPSPRDPAVLTGRTSCFRTMVFAASREFVGKLVPVRATEAHLWGFKGEICL